MMLQTPVSFIQALLDRRAPIQPSIAGTSRTLPGSMARPSTTASFPQMLQSLQAAQGKVSGSPTAYDGMFQAAATKYRLDPNLLKAVAKNESNFNPGAVSPAGAKGLMQIMPFNFQGLGISNPLDPTQSIEGGAQMLRKLLDKYGGDVSRALAAYNAGSGAVDKYGGIPPFAETQTYVKRVLDTLHGYQQTTPLTAASAAAPGSAGLASILNPQSPGLFGPQSSVFGRS
jgi:soluble lytic murein transglycosylase-like protein